MRLIYTATRQPVNVGDVVTLRGQRFTVDYFSKPHKPASEGKVTLLAEGRERPYGTEFYVSIIGAKWVEREDRQPIMPSRAFPIGDSLDFGTPHPAAARSYA